jgi:hypothetical protein
MANPYVPSPHPYGAPGAPAAPAPGPALGALPPTVVQTAQSLRTWTKLCGISLMVFGGLYCLTIVGIIAGWLPILLGYWIMKSGQQVAAYAEQGDTNLLHTGLGQLRNYFLVTGIGMILTILAVLAMILLYLIMGAAMVGLLGVAGAAAGA